MQRIDPVLRPLLGHAYVEVRVVVCERRIEMLAKEYESINERVFQKIKLGQGFIKDNL